MAVTPNTQKAQPTQGLVLTSWRLRWPRCISLYINSGDQARLKRGAHKFRPWLRTFWLAIKMMWPKEIMWSDRQFGSASRPSEILPLVTNAVDEKNLHARSIDQTDWQKNDKFENQYHEELLLPGWNLSLIIMYFNKLEWKLLITALMWLYYGTFRIEFYKQIFILQSSDSLIFPECRTYASVNWVIITSGNGVSPIRRQANTWTILADC